jgi:hypothetical protein
MTRRLSPLLLLLTLLVAAPSLAKVLAKGKPKGGFYWQKIEQKSGKTLPILQLIRNIEGW